MHDIWNPWHGCTKCSEGCRNCYMYALDAYREVKTPSSLCHRTGKFRYPLMRDKNTGRYKVRPGERIRVNMTSDTFLADADEWRDEMWRIIKARPDVIFWLLTKRPERIMDHLPDDWGDGYENVSLNVTCENQEMFDKRIEVFLAVPAKHKGMCLAPLLSDIDVSKALESGQIEEVSCGGENYDNPRRCDFEWVQHISSTCEKYRVNFFWYETGTNFYSGGQRHYIPKKAYQSMLPFFSGLNRKFYDIKFKLYDENGNEFDQNTRVKHYNANKCLFCANQDMCNGCSGCGDCRTNVELMDEKSFHEYQDLILSSGLKDKAVQRMINGNRQIL